MCQGEFILGQVLNTFRQAVLWWFLVTLGAGAAAISEEDLSFFESKVVPLLKARCFKCHSHEAGKMKGGLTLDSRSGWTEGGESGPAVVAGKPGESLLIKAIGHGDPDIKMPPKEKLADKEIALLTEWVARGAPDPRENTFEKDLTSMAKDWWSLVPLQRPALPATEADSQNPIDAFIRSRLQSAGLTPAARAGRRTLIRRLYLDLHGLPPTPQEVQRFAEDPDPGAYVRLVDRLLDSPRYGERWARHWLDTIHFADSHGCEHDKLRPNAWAFRDYVIRRLNDDVPWDRFIREQLAPDVFYPEETHLRAGLGFIGAGPLELSRASTAPVTFDYLDRDDMVTQTMAAFASTTANCARCHTHKFDPVSQEDYYSLQAVFAGVGKGDIEFDLEPRARKKREALIALQAAAEKQESEIVLATEYGGIVAQWEQAQGGTSAVWHPLNAETIHSSGGAELRLLDDGSYLASGPRPETDTYTVTGSLPLTTLSGIRLDALCDPSLPMKGPGRQDNGNLHLSEFAAVVSEPGAAEPRVLKIRRATADWNQEGWTIAHALDGNLKTAWGIYPKVGESHHAVFELAEPLTVKPGTRLTVSLQQLHGGGHLLGRFKLSLTDAPGAVADVLPPAVHSALQIPAPERSREARTTIAAHALKLHCARELESLPAMAVVYGASPAHSHGNKLPQPLATPKTVHVLHRGNIDQPGKVAHPGALSALSALPGRFDLPHPEREETRRAALADWLAARENPLTWRSIVNRVWHHHFGRGLCDTPNDFGRMGGTPSHPELLDWLAHWFRDDGQGSLKKLHRLILTSETYCQESNPHTGGATVVDAENRLLWRMNARRLDADCFRDSLLQISGRIDLTMGGPGIEQFVKSPGPQATPHLDYEAYDWSQPQAGRRSIYRVVWRGIADPFMEALDFPDMALLTPARSTSVSGLQALALFNNEFVLHHSEVLAARLEREHATLAEQARRAMQLVNLREPRDDELAALTAYATRCGLPALARVLFNSNEFLFIE